MSDEFKYEVGFSFLQEDEQLALEIADRIRDRVNVGVFLYSERQDELAGRDGVDSFSKVFAEDSRTVVILYREGWGQTKWTRVEENAIRTRGFDQGHDFVLLVKLDSTKPPVWLPPTRLYLGFERYGIDGVASAIEARVQSAGGLVRDETVADRALRISRNIDLQERRSAWRASGRAITDADQEAEHLTRELLRLADEVNGRIPRIQIDAVRNSEQSLTISTHDVRLTISWERIYANSLSSSRLYVILSRGGDYPFESPNELMRARYHIDLDATSRIGWHESNEPGRFFTSIQLAEFLGETVIRSGGGQLP